MYGDRHLAIAFLGCCLAFEPAAAQVGELDSDFGLGGVQTTDLRDTEYGYGVVVLADGRIAVAGVAENSPSSTRDAVLLHYRADGTFEASQAYGETVPGCSLVPEAFFALAQEADGRLLAGGYAQFGCSGDGERDFWIVRTEPDGAEVKRFDEERPTFFGHLDNLHDILVQPDGKIVAVGFAARNSDPASRDMAFARYNADGTLDETFDDDGEAVVDVSGDYDFARAGALQSDGKIVVAGFATTGGQRDIAVVRLNTDGSPDGTFGTLGVVTTDFFGLDEQALDVVVQPDGKIVVAASARNAGDTAFLAVALRYDTSGNPDSSFGTGGEVEIDFGGVSAAASLVAFQPDWRLVVAGNVLGPGGDPSRDTVVARLNADGALDSGFAGDGKQVFGIVPGQEDAPLGIALQDDGDIVLVGYTVEVVGQDEVTDFAIARLQVDLLFGDGFEAGDLSRWSAASAKPN